MPRRASCPRREGGEEAQRGARAGAEVRGHQLGLGSARAAGDDRHDPCGAKGAGAHHPAPF